MDPQNNARDDLHEKVSNLKIHGFSNAYSAKKYQHRFAWLLVSLVAIGFSMYGIVTSVLTYATFPVKIDITYQDEVLRDLPAVTICNVNKRHRSQRVIPTFDFGRKGISLLTGQWVVSQNEKARLGHQISGMLVSCRYKFVPCSLDDFILAKYTLNHMGNCFTFNSIKRPFRPKNEMTVNAVQPGNGLDMVLNIEQDEYEDETPDEGFIIFIHDSHHLPTMASASVSAPPGFATKIALSQVGSIFW